MNRLNEAIKKDTISSLLKEGISKGCHPEFQIISNSMSPILQIGDKISVKESTVKDLTIGDIVIYKLNDNIIAHRFLCPKVDATFITKGDNLPKIDQPIANDSLIGKVVTINKKGNKIDLETKQWRITNKLIGKSFFLLAKSSKKNRIVRLLNYSNSRFLKILALFINSEYRKIVKTKKSSLGLEKEFLKICSKKELNNQDVKFLEDVAEKGIDWDKFCWLSEYNSVAPIVFNNLSKIKDGLIPKDILQKLKITYTESFLKTAPIYDDVSKLLREFNSRKIKVIALKGCSLAEQLYKDFSLRPMKDIDILVKKQNWSEIKNILSKFNFKSEKDLLELENLLGIPVDWHLSYSNERNTKIEFKFNLFVLDFPEFNPEDYWKEAIPIKVNEVETFSLSIEDQILYLSCRMINVGFRNLLWFCDLRELLNTYKGRIQWDKLIAKARQKKSQLHCIIVFCY